ncbi:MAG: hypothetical protein AB7L91_12470 [Dehalococcoidia bacterium]
MRTLAPTQSAPAIRRTSAAATDDGVHESLFIPLPIPPFAGESGVGESILLFFPLPFAGESGVGESLFLFPVPIPPFAGESGVSS